MAKRYPTEQRVRATRMAVDRLDEYGSAWGVAQALGPKLGIVLSVVYVFLVRALLRGRRWAYRRVIWLGSASRLLPAFPQRTLIALTTLRAGCDLTSTRRTNTRVRSEMRCRR